MADRFGAVPLSSDRLRKELAGLGGEPAPVGAMLLVQDRVGAMVNEGDHLRL